MKKILFILFTLLTTVFSYSQYHTNYDWTETPMLHELTEEENELSSIGLLEKIILEFTQSSLTQDIYIYETIHNITKVNSEAGIMRHNRVYIPMYDVLELVNIKARTISPNGDIVNLDEANIKEIENVEEYGNFKIFAIEGVEKGSEIEVLYTLKKGYTPFGTELLQSDYLIKRAEVTLINNDLTGNIRTYNTDMNFELTYLDNMLVSELVVEDLKPIIEEEYATVEANKIYIAYQCFGNKEVTQELLWRNTVENVATNFLVFNDSLAVINDIKEEILATAPRKSDFVKANLIDDYIKTNFNIIENNNPNLNDIAYILESKTATDYSIIKAYSHLLNAFDIDFEIVITSNKYNKYFDPEFYNPNALRKFLIYLPDLELYISPDRIDYRVSEPPTNVLDNYGLFITKDVGYYFDIIAQQDEEYSRIKRKIDINFNESINNARITENQEYTGHWAWLYRAVFTYLTGESRFEVDDQLTGSGIEGKKTLELETINTSLKQLKYNEPFIVNSVIEAASLIEEADEDTYIFELGKVIGTQSELYQETERANPIVMQYPNQYNYTITVNIPKGYKLEGLESLALDKKLEIDGEIWCKFKSEYKITKKKLVIKIEESYNYSEYPLEKYDEFRSVINAASDFNKAAVIITKKQ